MPNQLVDNLLLDAQTMHYVSSTPTTGDWALQNAVQAAINTAALTGAYTATINVSSYTNQLVQNLIQKLFNLGYLTAAFGGTNLVITWN
jgi:hypothetical protein